MPPLRLVAPQNRSLGVYLRTCLEYVRHRRSLPRLPAPVDGNSMPQVPPLVAPFRVVCTVTGIRRSVFRSDGAYPARVVEAEAGKEPQGRQQIPYCCHNRNHGLCASVSSCLRLAAEMSFSRSGRLSGTAKTRSSHSMSAMVCSASMRDHHGARTGNASNCPVHPSGVELPCTARFRPQNVLGCKALGSATGNRTRV